MNLYVDALQSLYAVERQAESMTGRIGADTGVTAFKEFLSNAEAGAARRADMLEQVLTKHGESTDSLKTFVTKAAGSVHALIHDMAGHTDLKNLFALAGLHQYLIAAYTSTARLAIVEGDTDTARALATTAATLISDLSIAMTLVEQVTDSVTEAA